MFKPDLILCPYLTRKIPSAIYQHYTCLIVHPGIKGDRGPSSLDWAIQAGLSKWGMTLLQADDEMDAGPIWASRTFTLREASKSSVFNREVTQAAVDCLWEALSYFDAPAFQPEALDYRRPDVKGCLRPAINQVDRAIDWKKHKTADIVRRIRAADGSPGVLDELYGQPFYLFDAYPETRLTGKPGDLIATTDTAVCRATVDGAVWIGHLQPKRTNGKGIKLPAVMALQGYWPKSAATWSGLSSKPIRHIDIDYTRPGRQLPCQQVWYEEEGGAAYLYFPFHNGAMSTAQCRLLLTVYRHVAALPVSAIVLMGGEEFWSNGIHLNHFEAAVSPADESWDNINAIDDLIYQIVNTPDKLTVAAVAGNAGAGGAILAIAPDRTWVRDGVVFNPHYKNMGELYGSEYWTYLLPKRVGQKEAIRITEARLPISAKQAWRLGVVEKVLDRQHAIFAAQVKHLVGACLANPESLAAWLAEKAAIRCVDEAEKPLAAYRKFELTQMYANFYGNDAYHQARRQFVYKTPATATPENLASHRQTFPQHNTPQAGSLIHFNWLESYALGDEKVDEQHKDFFVLAERMVTAPDKPSLLATMGDLYQHVKVHFGEEEATMKQVGYHHYQSHVREHNLMLEKLVAMDKKISNDQWADNDVLEFTDKWKKHIVLSDLAFNQHWKEMFRYSV